VTTLEPGYKRDPDYYSAYGFTLTQTEEREGAPVIFDVPAPEMRIHVTAYWWSRSMYADCATKAGFGPQIRVNAVPPGLVDTPWIAGYTGVREHITASAPLRRVGTPEDIAKVVCDVVDSTYLTGEVIGVDGGFHLR